MLFSSCTNSGKMNMNIAEIILYDYNYFFSPVALIIVSLKCISEVVNIVGE